VISRPSGTSFDPSPQFWVHQVEPGRSTTVTGRCWFGPVIVGMWFDTVAVKSADDWAISPCHLRVDEITVAAHQLVDELDQMWSAQLILSGGFPPDLIAESLLAARDCSSSGDWERKGALWRRRAR
jgi:hypothetical protein